MSGEEPFDFRTLMSSGRAGAPSTRGCIVGVAWTAVGIGLVALPRESAGTTTITAYNNLALGPFGSDHSTMAQTIALLPAIFEGKDPLFFLGGAADGSMLRGVETALARVFPGMTTLLRWPAIDAWAAETGPIVTQPDIPQRDRWCAKPIRAAAETALYAGCLLAGQLPSPTGLGETP